MLNKISSGPEEKCLEMTPYKPHFSLFDWSKRGDWERETKQCMPFFRVRGAVEEGGGSSLLVLEAIRLFFGLCTRGRFIEGLK